MLQQILLSLQSLCIPSLLDFTLFKHIYVNFRKSKEAITNVIVNEMHEEKQLFDVYTKMLHT